MNASQAIDTQTDDERPPAETLRPVAPRPSGSRRPFAAVLLRACRPRQWTKNVLVVAAPAAAGLLGHGEILLEVLAAFVVMCMASSATYLVNDVRDAEQDRLHPRKRHRPVASGELSATAAMRSAVVLAAAAILISLPVSLALAGVVAFYLLLTGVYSLWLRRVPYADIATIAAGFVLRALAGGAATDVRLSRWFVLVTGFGAVFLVACKRFAELREHLGKPATRAALRSYTTRGLQAIILAAAFGMSAAYIGWAVTRPDDAWLFTASALPLLFWLGRYVRLVAQGRGQAPEDLVLHDPLLLTSGAVWAAACAVGIYAGV